MARQNYKAEKRRRELEKKKKKEAKRAKRLQRSEETTEPTENDPTVDNGGEPVDQTESDDVTDRPADNNNE